MRKIVYSVNMRRLLLVANMLFSVQLHAQKNTITINWDSTLIVSKTVPTLQVVVNPMLAAGSIIHEGIFEALENLEAEYVRFVPWYPYPHYAVAELEPPSNVKTFWDFSYLDPIVKDFMKSQKSRPVVMDFSTIPHWMFKTDSTLKYPASPDSIFRAYNTGYQFRDTTFGELASYYERLLNWYTKGGFTDELGVFHKSGFFYHFPFWEVLNEPDLEHFKSPQLYTKAYDAIVTALKRISPETKFIGLSLASQNNPEWFEYFLNPLNHSPDVHIEGISYHFYAKPDFKGQTLDYYQYSFFNKADAFLQSVRFIESIKNRFAPQSFTMINEIGNILRDQTGLSISDSYWNLSAAMFAYLYVELSKIGIDVVGESQLVGYPTQFPSVSMIDWRNAIPNARYWVVKLLKDNFQVGDTLVSTSTNSSQVFAQALITGRYRKLLLINKRNTHIEMELPVGLKYSQMISVEGKAGEKTGRKNQNHGASVVLKPFAVTILILKD